MDLTGAIVCKRTDEDPLVRYFVDEYHLNLLAHPREGAAVGDLYVQDKHGITAPGHIAGLLVPAPALDLRPRTETLAGLGGKLSRRISFTVGVGLLENFLLALGVGGVLSALKLGYTKEGTATVRFRFDRAQRESVDIGLLARSLAKSTFDASSPLVNPGNRYYLVAAVVRTPSLSVVAENAGQQAVEIGAEVLATVNASTGLDARRSSSGEVTFEGERPLAIGVEVYELLYDEKAGKLRMSNPEGALALRGDKPSGRAAGPAVMGDPDGDALVAVR